MAKILEKFTKALKEKTGVLTRQSEVEQKPHYTINFSFAISNFGRALRAKVYLRGKIFQDVAKS